MPFWSGGPSKTWKAQRPNIRKQSSNLPTREKCLSCARANLHWLKAHTPTKPSLTCRADPIQRSSPLTMFHKGLDPTRNQNYKSLSPIKTSPNLSSAAVPLPKKELQIFDWLYITTKKIVHKLQKSPQQQPIKQWRQRTSMRIEALPKFRRNTARRS